MNTLTDLIDRYIATWNEADPERRRDLIARTYSDGALYLDPMLQAEGRDGIDAMIVSVQERFPGHRFRRTGDVESHHNASGVSKNAAADAAYCHSGNGPQCQGN